MPPFRATPLVRALLCSAALCLPTPSHTAGLEASASATPPDIYGPGAVLRAGNVRMKVTNAGVLGNPFPNLSTDPAATWPDSSGVEYLTNIGFAVAAKDLAPPAGAAAYRVSYLTEWSPVSSNAIDRIYRTFQLYLWGGHHCFRWNTLQAYRMLIRRPEVRVADPGLMRRMMSIAYGAT